MQDRFAAYESTYRAGADDRRCRTQTSTSHPQTPSSLRSAFRLTSTTHRCGLRAARRTPTLECWRLITGCAGLGTPTGPRCRRHGRVSSVVLQWHPIPGTLEESCSQCSCRTSHGVQSNTSAEDAFAGFRERSAGLCSGRSRGAVGRLRRGSCIPTGTNRLE